MEPRYYENSPTCSTNVFLHIYNYDSLFSLIQIATLMNKTNKYNVFDAHK